MADTLLVCPLCPVCWYEFSDPVSLRCQHSFCRECIRAHLAASGGSAQCPECRQPFTRKHIKANRTLGNCRLAEEKAQRCKNALRGAVSFLSEEMVDLDYKIRLQTAEIKKTQDTSREWSGRISTTFEQLHQLLREKEQEVQTFLQQEEKRVLEPMQRSLAKMTQVSTRDRNTEGTLRSGLDIGHPDAFLQWWTTVGCNKVKKMLDGDEAVAEGTDSTTDLRFSSKLAGLAVFHDVISLGPYETHLSFLVWRDILRDIQPVPHDDVISLWDDSYAMVTHSGRSIQRRDRRGLFGRYQDYRPLAKCRAAYPRGRHYFEVEMGRKLDWGIGVCTESPSGKVQEVAMLYRRHDGVYSSYSVTAQGQESALQVLHPPWQIGVYLDCDKGRVAFYDADSMEQVCSAACGTGAPLSLCLSPGARVEGGEGQALTVCCYQSLPQSPTDMDVFMNMVQVLGSFVDRILRRIFG
ncbi:tripartite motif containing 109 [Sardina pilchardus]|uniref:tripartite motif containing 109 n=1 Tax=Sardina pilchardus TaxID=27697 RepID=UPI002E114865